MVVKPDAVWIDACAILWIIHWPIHGTVHDYLEGFRIYVLHKLADSNTYVIFDRYNNYSNKSET